MAVKAVIENVIYLLSEVPQPTLSRAMHPHGKAKFGLSNIDVCDWAIEFAPWPSHSLSRPPGCK